MMSRVCQIGAVAVGLLLPGLALAQSGVEIRYPDGTVLQPLPVVPAMEPDGDVVVTGSVRTPANPPWVITEVERQGRGPDASTVCRVQTYRVGPNGVRVHRC